MKRKRKVTNAASTCGNTLESSVMCPGPNSAHPNPKNREPSENRVKEEDEDVNLEAPHQNMDDTGDRQTDPCPGPDEGQLDAAYPEASSLWPTTAVLPACHQGDHRDPSAGENAVLLQTFTTDITEQATGGGTGKFCPVPTAESSITRPSEADMAPTCINETMNISGQVNRDYQECEISYFPIMEEKHVNGNGCEAGDVSEMPRTDTCINETVSAIPGDGSQEPKCDLQEATLNETPDLYDLAHTPNIPDVPSQSDPQDLAHTPNIPEITAQSDPQDLAHTPNIPEITAQSDPQDLEHTPNIPQIAAQSDPQDLAHTPNIPEITAQSDPQDLAHTPNIPEITSQSDPQDLAHSPNIPEITSQSDPQDLAHTPNIPEITSQSDPQDLEHTPNIPEITAQSDPQDLAHTPNIPEITSQSDPQDLAHSPNIPEITSQSDPQDSQRITEVPPLPYCDLKIQARDEEHCQDPKSQPEVMVSPELTSAQKTNQHIPSQQTDARSEDFRGLTNGLDLQDSQLLGALEESFNESAKSCENHISDLKTSASHGQEMTWAPPSPSWLSETSAPAQDIRGLQQQRTEDASSTVQGLILELSNINRLIMSTYRELRQRRLRHAAGGAAVSGRRRCDM